MLVWFSSLALAAPADLSVGVLAHSFAHPGLHARGTWPIAQRLHAGLEIGGYAHPGNQVALWLMPTAHLRSPKESGLIWDVGLSAGALRSSWWEPTWVDGERQALAGAGYGTAKLDLALGRGLDGRLSHWLLGPSLSLRAPHALGLGVDVFLSLDLGI